MSYDVKILGSRRLPCGQQAISKPENDRVVRCKMCRRKWILHLVPAAEHVRVEMLDQEIYVIEWEAV